MSERLHQAIQACKDRGEGVFMPFLVIGDPDLETSQQLTDALVEAGSDILEFGFAFSDPPADGPVIQAADDRALAAGMTPAKGFEYLAAVRARHPQPIILLLYYNLILQFPGGVDGFYARAAQVGVDGILVADLPFEMGQQALKAARTHGIAPIFIGSAVTHPDRLTKLSDEGDGFLYVVARLGVTGEKADLDQSLPETLAHIRSQTSLPLLCGFGISHPDHIRSVLSAGADGAIVGSALVRQITQNLDDIPTMITAVRARARTLKNATRTKEI